MNLEPTQRREASGGDAYALLEGYERTRLRFDTRWTETLMRGARIGSAGVVVLVAGYAPYFPRVGTSPAVIDNRAFSLGPAGAVRLDVRAPSVRRAVMSLSVADQALELLAALSLNKSQLAEVLRVSRPTLYDWLEGKEPNAANAERLTTLLGLFAEVGITSSSPLHQRLVRQPLVEKGLALIDALCASTIDESVIRSLAKDAKELVQRSDARRISREERLRALGFEDPSEEQRREQLAHNVAQRKWPKT